jgi:ABC-type multidrug transport system fused ATPase/permease subunit
MRPISTSCADHMGSAWARVHTWDGAKWNFTSDWYQADEQIIKPMVKARPTSTRPRRSSSAARRRTARAEPTPEAAPAAPPQGGDASGPAEPVPRRPRACPRERAIFMSNILLNVNGIEVIYNHVILVLKGVSLQVPEGGVVALLGGNGAGKTTTLRAVSNLLAGERGEVTKGSIELRGERIEKLSTSDMVKRGVIQVMEGRHCFAHLTSRRT